MAPQIVLISGCSSGMGLATAVLLAKDPEKRFKVYATMRNLAKKAQLEEEGKEHVGDTLIIEQMDVCCDESVNKTVQDVIDKEGRIDVLFNNAGIGLFSVVECTPIKMAQEMFDVNFFGVLRLIKAVLPHMKARESGHIIINSSENGLVGVPIMDIYSASKFAVEGLAESLTPSLRQFNIRCTMLELGPVATPIHDTSAVWAQIIDYSTVDEKTKQQMGQVRGAIAGAFDSALMPGQVAKVVKEIILSEKPCFRYQINVDYLAEEIACKLTDPTGNKPLEMITRRFFGDQEGDNQ